VYGDLRQRRPRPPAVEAVQRLDGSPQVSVLYMDAGMRPQPVPPGLRIAVLVGGRYRPSLEVQSLVHPEVTDRVDRGRGRIHIEEPSISGRREPRGGPDRRHPDRASGGRDGLAGPALPSCAGRRRRRATLRRRGARACRDCLSRAARTGSGVPRICRPDPARDARPRPGSSLVRGARRRSETESRFRFHANRPDHLLRVGVPTRPLLGIDQAAVHRDFEHAAPGLDELDLRVAEGLPEPGRQPGGSGSVVSNRAVLDAHLHVDSPR